MKSLKKRIVRPPTIPINYLCLLIAIGYSSTIFGQQINQELISCFGTLHSNAKKTVDSSVGEPFSTVITNSDKIITQGFHQPKKSDTYKTVRHSLDVQIYPNPVNDILNIELFDDMEIVKITISNSQGKTMLQNEFEMKNSNTIKIDVSEFISGLYSLEIQNEKLTKTFKIVKS